MKRNKPVEHHNPIKPWTYGQIVRDVLAIDWEMDDYTVIVPFRWDGPVSGPQYVFWPLHLPPDYFMEMMHGDDG